jgi:N-acetylglucosaminyl-diphospho-decaprenol L-rhamnosyltransferase
VTGRHDVAAQSLRSAVAEGLVSMPPEAADPAAHPVALSIVIVSWNSRVELAACVSSLLKFTSVDFEVIVVDNASSDGSAELIRSAFPSARLIRNSTNLGFARACNQGMACARGRHILLLNSDTYVADDAIGRAVRLLESRPDIGMLGVELCFPNGRRQHTAARALGIRQSLLERLWLYKLLPTERRAEALLGGYWEENREIEVDWLAGAFLLFRRELFERSGGFDERFFMYGEDSEWCMRLGKLGFKILYAPRVGVVYHTGAVSAHAVWTEKERLRRCYEGGLGAYSALYGRRRALLYRAAELIGVTVRGSAYRLASLTGSGNASYYRRQALFYRWLVEFYLHPSRETAR